MTKGVRQEKLLLCFWGPDVHMGIHSPHKKKYMKKERDCSQYRVNYSVLWQNDFKRRVKHVYEFSQWLFKNIHTAVCACSVIEKYVNKTQIRYLEQNCYKAKWVCNISLFTTLF